MFRAAHRGGVGGRFVGALRLAPADALVRRAAKRAYVRDDMGVRYCSRARMKIHLVSLEDGITATGFRKMAAYVERLNGDTRVFYVGTQRYRSMWKSFVRKMGETRAFGDDQIDEIAHGLIGADIIAFSSMTGYSDLTKRLAKRVREIAPQSYVMWGGIHPIIYAEDAITADVDAICTGEGEHAFEEWLDAFKRGADSTKTANFWFKRDGVIQRNPFRPLMSARSVV